MRKKLAFLSILLVTFLACYTLGSIPKSDNLTKTEKNKMASIPGLKGDVPSWVVNGKQATIGSPFTTNKNTGIQVEGQPGVYVGFGATSTNPGVGTPDATSNNTGGSADPYAAERAAALSRARESFTQGRSNVYDSARSQVGSFVGNQRNNILDFIDSLRTGQQGIDRGRVKAQLGKERASDGIMGMVGRGIKSGATMLANKNAGDSSATGAIARAYGELGNRQQSDVNNQFGMENADLDVNQQALETQRNSGMRRFDTDQDNQVNGIVDQARQAFAALNEAATGAGIEERIAIAQEKEKIRNDVMSRLSVLDKTLRGASDVKAMGREGVLQEAGRLDQLGQGEASRYNFTEQAPVQLQGGFQPGQLPIYSNRRREV